MRPSVEVFEAAANSVGAEFHHLPSKTEALAFLAQVLHDEAVTNAPGGYAVWAADSELNEVERNSPAATHPGVRFDVTKQLAADARIGISEVAGAIAETGTLFDDSTRIERRLISTLPPVHIALLATDRIVPNLTAALTQIGPERAAYLAMITGPSRTADIERVLTIGVHGPSRLLILAYDRVDGGAQ